MPCSFVSSYWKEGAWLEVLYIPVLDNISGHICITSIQLLGFKWLARFISYISNLDVSGSCLLDYFTLRVYEKVLALEYRRVQTLSVEYCSILVLSVLKSQEEVLPRHIIIKDSTQTRSQKRSPRSCSRKDVPGVTIIWMLGTYGKVPDVPLLVINVFVSKHCSRL